MRSVPARALLLVAILIGVGARVALVFEQPLWADEIFTLTLARQPVASIVDALRVDSGPPLHYLLSRLLLLPFGPSPGPHDVVVRLFSLGASLLHLPLLVLVARRLGKPETGLPAAALYGLFPLAASFAAEGRSYALASLLCLAAFERALALRETPTAGRAVALAFAAGGAVGTHYLSVFPVAGLAVLIRGAGRRSKASLVLGGAGGALLFLPWLPVALGQPSDAMAWARGPEFSMTPFHFPVNLAFAVPAGRSLAVLLPLSLLFLGAAFLFTWRGPFRPVASVLLAGSVLLVLAHLVAGVVLLPDRPAVLLLPFVALLYAGSPRPVSYVSAAASMAGLLALLKGAAVASPGERLASLLLPEMKRGQTACAVALWGPELDYRLTRAGLPHRIVLFPSDVARHPGWLHEAGLDPDRLATEARALLSSPGRPTLFVLPRGSRATAALDVALAPLGPRRRASGVLVDVVELPPGAP